MKKSLKKTVWLNQVKTAKSLRKAFEEIQKQGIFDWKKHASLDEIQQQGRFEQNNRLRFK